MKPWKITAALLLLLSATAVVLIFVAIPSKFGLRTDVQRAWNKSVQIKNETGGVLYLDPGICLINRSGHWQDVTVTPINETEGFTTSITREWSIPPRGLAVHHLGMKSFVRCTIAKGVAAATITAKPQTDSMPSVSVLYIILKGDQGVMSMRPQDYEPLDALLKQIQLQHPDASRTEELGL